VLGGTTGLRALGRGLVDLAIKVLLLLPHVYHVSVVPLDVRVRQDLGPDAEEDNASLVTSEPEALLPLGEGASPRRVGLERVVVTAVVTVIKVVVDTGATEFSCI